MYIENSFVGDPCPQPNQLTAEDLEPCAPRVTYDYFTGSELPYIIGITSLGVFPLGRFILCKSYRVHCFATMQVFNIIGVALKFRWNIWHI